jgi:archaetidylinositol phosphate synthase
MSKLPSELDNPVDVQIYRFIPAMARWAHRNCLTPNHITTLSMIGGFIAIWGLYTHQPWIFAVGYIIAYVLDSLDGFVARKYNMVTQFGDYYDHVKDAIIHVILFIGMIHLARQQKSLWLIGVLAVAMYVAMIHLKLMDEYHCKIEREKKMCQSPTIDVVRWVIPEVLLAGDVRAGLLATRWLGLGTFGTLMVIIGVWLAA